MKIIDLNKKSVQSRKDDGFGGIPFGAVCGFTLTIWVICMMISKLLGWM